MICAGIDAGSVTGIVRRTFPKGPGAYAWRGGRKVTPGGYVYLYTRGHHRGGGIYAAEHILVVERAIQKELRTTAVVHHINGQRTDNRNENLVACHDSAYHMLIEARTRSYRATGRPDSVKCWVCGEYGADVLKKARHNTLRRAGYHRTCEVEYQRRHYTPKGLKTHCRHGHAFAGDNLAWAKDGSRRCMTCERAKVIRLRAKWKAERAAL